MELEKERIDALKAHQSEYLNSVWKTFAALMVAIGWVISSKDTRYFLSQTPAVKYVILASIFLMALMHWLTLKDLYRKSQQIVAAAPIENALYQVICESYEVKKVYVYASFLINGALYVLLGVTVWQVG